MHSTSTQHDARQLITVALAFGLAHVVLSWGFIGGFWLDAGRWLHEIDRYAHGEVLYRDYVWPFPPMAMWILGGIARLAGSSLDTIWTATSIVFLLLLVLYAWYVRELVHPALRTLTLLAGLCLAVAHANWASPPLPLGMYTPAAPIGFLFLFGALLAFLRMSKREPGSSGRLLAAACVGLLCGLAILTKQDFWAPSSWLALYAGAQAGFRRGSPDRVESAAILAPLVLTLAAGAAVVGMTAGWTRLWDIVGGFGRVAEFQGRQFPSWERITIQVAGASLVGFLGLGALLWGGSLSFREARKWLGLLAGLFLAAIALHVAMSFRIGRLLALGASVPQSDTRLFMQRYEPSTGRLLFGSLVWSHVRLENNLFPAFLPAALGIGLISGRRLFRRTGNWRTLSSLVVLCLAARLRRGFEHVEWFHLMLELPVAVACVAEILRVRGRVFKRGLRASVAALLCFGSYSQARWGQGSLVSTARYERIDTPRGTIHLLPHEAEQYRSLQQALARLDPGGKRPLLAFGYSGGFNYFLDRPNPTPLEEGFQFSGFPVERILDQIDSSSPPAVLLDSGYYRNIYMPAPWLCLSRWEIPTVLNVHMRVDRPLFEQAIRGCREFERILRGGSPEFVLYDCAPPPNNRLRESAASSR